MNTKILLFKICKATGFLTLITFAYFFIGNIIDSLKYSKGFHFGNIDEYLFQSLLIGIIPSVFYVIARYASIRQFFTILASSVGLALMLGIFLLRTTFQGESALGLLIIGSISGIAAIIMMLLGFIVRSYRAKQNSRLIV